MLFAKGQYLLKALHFSQNFAWCNSGVPKTLKGKLSASTSKTKHLHVHMYKVNNTAKNWMQEKCNCPMMKQEHESNFVNLYFFYFETGNSTLLKT